MDISNPTSVAIDVTVILSSGIVMQFMQVLCRKKCYPFIATKLFELKNEKLIFHFAKSLWKYCWHFFCFVLGLIVLIPSDFWDSIMNPYNKKHGTSLYWSNINDYQLPSIGIRLLYLFQIGYYVTDFVYVVKIDKPNDWLTMSIHHITTLSLLWMSYLPKNGWKIGCGILLIHDIGDVSLMFTKTLHYAQFEKISNILFIFHVLTWIWSRLIWFPRIIASIFIDISSNAKIWQRIPCGILLCVLLILHIFWTFLMLKVVYKAFIGGEKMADKRDRDNPMTTVNENNNDIQHDKDTVGVIESKLESIELDKTDAINATKHVRRRSSLVESFIETKESIVMPENS